MRGEIRNWEIPGAALIFNQSLEFPKGGGSFFFLAREKHQLRSWDDSVGRRENGLGQDAKEILNVRPEKWVLTRTEAMFRLDSLARKLTRAPFFHPPSLKSQNGVFNIQFRFPAREQSPFISRNSRQKGTRVRAPAW